MVIEHPIHEHVPNGFRSYNEYYRTLSIGEFVKYYEDVLTNMGVVIGKNSYDEYDTDIRYYPLNKSFLKEEKYDTYVVHFYVSLVDTDIVLNSIISLFNDFSNKVHIENHIERYSESELRHLSKIRNKRITINLCLENYFTYIRNVKIEELLNII